MQTAIRRCPQNPVRPLRVGRERLLFTPRIKTGALDDPLLKVLQYEKCTVIAGTQLGLLQGNG